MKQRRLTEDFKLITELPDEIVVKNDLSYSLFTFFVFVVVAVACFFLWEFDNSFWKTLVMVFLVLLVLIKLIFLLDRRVKIKINAIELYINNHTFHWNNVRNTFIEFEEVADGTTHFTDWNLIVKTFSNKEYKFSLNRLDYSIETIAGVIEGYKTLYRRRI